MTEQTTVQPSKNSSSVRPAPRDRVRGQGLTEYIIVVAVIALAAVAAVGYFGSTVKAQFVSMGTELIGEEGDPAAGAAAPPPTDASGLDTYTD